MKLINVRGCNGSGKTTLLRLLAAESGCRVANVEVPGHRPIPVTYVAGGVALLGDYSPDAKGTTAGCDRIKTQDAIKNALCVLLADPEVKAIIFEGVVVATIFGPWKEFADAQGGMVWAFLDTPLDVCLRRIQERNGGKPIQEDQVASKHRTIARVSAKVGEMNNPLHPVADIHWDLDPLGRLKYLISALESRRERE